MSCRNLHSPPRRSAFRPPTWRPRLRACASAASACAWPTCMTSTRRLGLGLLGGGAEAVRVQQGRSQALVGSGCVADRPILDASLFGCNLLPIAPAHAPCTPPLPHPLLLPDVCAEAGTQRRGWRQGTAAGGERRTLPHRGGGWLRLGGPGGLFWALLQPNSRGAGARSGWWRCGAAGVAAQINVVSLLPQQPPAHMAAHLPPPPPRRCLRRPTRPPTSPSSCASTSGERGMQSGGCRVPCGAASCAWQSLSLAARSVALCSHAHRC